MTIARATAVVVFLSGCGAAQAGAAPTAPLELVAESARRWTGVAVMRDGRIVVSYPRWSDDVPISLATLRADGTPEPFPDATWNEWSSGADPSSTWVCVQAVYVDASGTLWVVDSGNPQMRGVIEGAPKLVGFADDGDSVPNHVIRFAAPAIHESSYLNDVRIDAAEETAYLTDSGAGAILVVDLATGDTRRLLDDDASTEPEEITLEIGGEPWLRDGAPPRVRSDGIALDEAGGWLYFQALTARTLHRVPVALLRGPSTNESTLSSAVESFRNVGAVDGLLFHEGLVWLTSLELDAVQVIAPDDPSPSPRVIVEDPRLAWPDTLAVAPDGSVLVITSQIHRGPHPAEPYRIFRIRHEGGRR